MKSNIFVAQGLLAVMLLLAWQIAAAEDFTCQADYSSEYLVPSAPANFYQYLAQGIHEANTYKSYDDDACLITLTQLEGLKTPVIVDVREEEAFASYSIPHSVNIPEYQITTRKFLKKRTIVLVHESYKTMDLVPLCNTLKQEGFSSVYVLMQGIAGWGAKEKNRSDLPVIDANSFYASAYKNRWIVVDIKPGLKNNESASELKSSFPVNYQQVTELANLDQNITDWVNQYRAKYQQSPDVLIVDKNGSLRSKLINRLSSTYTRLYYLKNGRQGFNQYLQDHRKMIAQKYRAQAKRGCK